jgi:hypothetical protein
VIAFWVSSLPISPSPSSRQLEKISRRSGSAPQESVEGDDDGKTLEKEVRRLPDRPPGAAQIALSRRDQFVFDPGWSLSSSEPWQTLAGWVELGDEMCIQGSDGAYRKEEDGAQQQQERAESSYSDDHALILFLSRS